MVRVLIVGSLLVLYASCLGMAQARPAHYHTGHVSYRQMETEVTLDLGPGSTFDVDSTRGRRGATLSFAPGGKSGGAPTFFLQFWMSGNNPFIVALEVRGGQGGNAYYDGAESHCTLKVTRLDAHRVEGSGACGGKFEGGGTPIATFSFIATE
jgi:hypothetical protein